MADGVLTVAHAGGVDLESSTAPERTSAGVTRRRATLYGR